MNRDDIPSLIDRLRSLAGQWAAAQEPPAPLARLGRLVINDGGFFARIDTPGATTTVATIERFARWLAEAGNWPEGVEVPDEARAFAHVVGVTPEQAGESPGKAGDDSPQAAAA